MFYKYAIISCLIMVMFLTACKDDLELLPGLDQEFQLKVGQTVQIQGEEIAVKFVKVIGDCRCPMEVQCAWEGEATIQANIAQVGQDGVDVELTLRGGNYEDLAIESFDKYVIKLVEVDPYPKEEEEIDFSNYVVTLIVSKQ